MIDDTISEEVLSRLQLKINSGTADHATLQEFLNALDIYEKKLATSGTKKWFVEGTPYGIEHCPKHKGFFDSGADYPERIFLASNRTGKTISGAFEMACHLTGDYPSWWAGRVFDKPVSAWAVGSTARSTRDVIQKELLGPIGSWGTGLIPEEKMGRFWALQGTPQAVDVIEIRHKSGGMSTLGFKNYEQPIEAFYGTDKHVIWLDEECPQNVWNECLIRTMTTKGIQYVTFTPLAGLTPFVVNFCSKADFLYGALAITAPAKREDDEDEGEDARLAAVNNAKAVIQAGWDDAPWLEGGEKARRLDDTLPHLRAARSRGIPAMGSGNVYPIPFEEIAVAPFKIPDHFKRMYALDVGWNKTAVLWFAIDPNSDVMYVTDEHYMGEQPPPVHAQAIRGRGEWITGVIDPASRGRSQIDGQQLMHMYKNELGLRLFPAKNEVEGGIASVWLALSTGKLKVFSHLHHFASEYLIYRRDVKGRVIKERDHLMDCLRYGVINAHRATHKRALNSGGANDGSRRYDF